MQCENFDMRIKAEWHLLNVLPKIFAMHLITVSCLWTRFILPGEKALIVDRFNIKIIYVPFNNKQNSQIGEFGSLSHHSHQLLWPSGQSAVL